MGAPGWWRRRRFGLAVQTSIASVPAWAPIGEYPSWYAAHLDGDARDVLLHAAPLVETLAHHQERWGHVERYEDFLPFLTFDDFDPDAWTALARDAGMSYVVGTAKHHDGFCWWDAPGTDFTAVEHGPKRNVLAELAAATERAGLDFGASYSLLDWHDVRYPGTEFVDEVVHRQALDLVERYGVKLLWGEGHWGAGPDHWRSDELVKRAREIEPDLIVNDRWWTTPGCVSTYEYRVPDSTDLRHPFEVRRGIGGGFGYNRLEDGDHLMSTSDIVALLTEVVAKGGHLTLTVGTDATGSVPSEAAERLRGAGGWIRRHADLLERGEAWTSWGDDGCRYLTLDGALHAVDVGGKGRFPHLDRSAGPVRSVTTLDGTVVGFDQDDRGLRLERQPRRGSRLPVVYRLELDEPPAAPIELFPSSDGDVVELAPLLADAEPGELVQLGEGRYIGPARVPPGVTVRGLGPGRTHIDGVESVAVTLAEGARLEHCSVAGGGERIAWLPIWVVDVPGDGAAMLGCDVDGHVRVTGDDTRMRSCRTSGIVADGAERLDVCRSSFVGMQWDCALDISGGAGHVVEGCEFADVLTAIRLTGTVGGSVRGNQIKARWWGVQLIDTEATTVAANSMTSVMRAVDVDGGTQAHITGNAVNGGDSGCLVQRGASDVEVSGNHWERCRVGLFAWDCGDVRHHDNAAVDLLESGAEAVIAP